MLTVDDQKHLRSLEVEEDCASSHNQTGIVVWLTGISGAGKTTVADAMAGKLSRSLPELVLVDGNVIRDLFGASLGFHEEARVEQIGRIQRIAKFLAEQGQCVVVSALYSNPDLMRWNRDNLPGYFEVLIDASLELVRIRDPRGIYAKAAVGEMPHVVGLDVPWHKPEMPDMVLDPVTGDSPENMADQIISALPRLSEEIG